MRTAIVFFALLEVVFAQQLDAIAAYRAGRYTEAHAAFAAAFAAAGDAAPAALRWNVALAALRVQRSGDAEAAVQPWLASEDAVQRADAEFVTAMASFQRAERAALAAQLPDAEPLAWTMALQLMQRAEAGFRRAADARAAWPEAARNAERAHARLAELQKLREQAQQANVRPEPEPPSPPPPAPSQPTPEEVPTAVTKDALAPAEVAALLQRVDRKEREKRNLRRERQQQVAATGERGW